MLFCSVGALVVGMLLLLLLQHASSFTPLRPQTSPSSPSSPLPKQKKETLDVVRGVVVNSDAPIRNKFGGDIALVQTSNNTMDDIPLYITLGMMQLLPPLSIFMDATVGSPEFLARKGISYLYFVVTASLTVFLGSRRSDIKVFEGESLIGPKNAIAAPFISSAILFTFYTVLKSANFEKVFEVSYQILALLIGGLSIDTIISLSFINNVTSEQSVSVEESAKEGNDISTSTEGLVISSVVVLGYLLSSSLGNGDINSYFAIAFFNNIIAVSIALQATSLVRVKNFAVCCALLSGLFFYDVYFVFGSDIMMTVATKVEAPVKMLFPASLSTIPDRSYPYSVLGLGDIVVPGIMSAFAYRFDCMKKNAAALEVTKIERKSGIFSRRSKKTETPVLTAPQSLSASSYSYLNSSVVGYISGLLLAFTANEVMQRGQPALLYLVPTVISSMFITAFKNEEFGLLWGEGLSEVEKV